MQEACCWTGSILSGLCKLCLRGTAGTAVSERGGGHWGATESLLARPSVQGREGEGNWVTGITGQVASLGSCCVQENLPVVFWCQGRKVNCFPACTSPWCVCAQDMARSSSGTGVPEKWGHLYRTSHQIFLPQFHSQAERNHRLFGHSFTLCLLDFFPIHLSMAYIICFEMFLLLSLRTCQLSPGHHCQTV